MNAHGSYIPSTNKARQLVGAIIRPSIASAMSTSSRAACRASEAQGAQGADDGCSWESGVSIRRLVRCAETHFWKFMECPSSYVCTISTETDRNSNCLDST